MNLQRLWTASSDGGTICGRASFAALVLFASCRLVFATEVNDSIARLGETVLDLDRDGRPDRAVLVRNSGDRSFADLHIYFGVGGTSPEVTRPPDLIKQHLLGGQLYEISAGRDAMLVLSSRCGGCSNEYVTTLKIVDRGTRMLVAGFSANWELRDGRMGECDVNYLTGRGFASRGLDGRRTRMRLKPHQLYVADWSEHSILRECLP